MEERDRRSGSGGRAVDELWTGWRGRNSMGGRDRRSGSGGRAVDELWTGGSCRNSMGGGRAGGAEIAWEEAGDGGARLKGMIQWTGGGRVVDGRELQK